MQVTISPAQSLRDQLFGHHPLDAFVIIDGAACPGLLDILDQTQPDYECLYAGEMDPSVEEVAPFLIRLDPDHPFSDWLFASIDCKPWGIFLATSAGIRDLRKHFRTFLLVKGPDGNTLYFRYYDPRVLSAYLPTTDDDERKQVFGPVEAYYCLTPARSLLMFQNANGNLKTTELVPGRESV